MKKIFIFFRICKNSLKNEKSIFPIFLIVELVINFLLTKIVKNLNKKFFSLLIEKKYLRFAVRYVDSEEKKQVSSILKSFNTIETEKNSPYYNDLKHLREYGYLKLEKYFNEEECNLFIKNLNNKNYFNSQTFNQSDGKLYKFNETFFQNPPNEGYVSFFPEDFFHLGFFQKMLKDKKINYLIKNYLNFESTIYNAVTWLNFPNKNKHYVQRWHRDYDDFKFLTLIIYWTDVNEFSGATLFKEKSHDKNLSDFKTISFEGKKGKIILADTYALHKAIPVVSNYRISTWIRFGKYINSASLQNGFTETPKNLFN